jgi:hemolysin III
MSVIKDFSLKEEIANSILHGIGAVFSIVFLVLLIIKGVKLGTPWHIVSYTIFGVSLLILYTMSTIYHAFPKGTAKNIFERFDHISIYLLIAGTYTPFCFTILKGPLGWTIFGIQWGIAVLGIVFKSIWIKKYVTFSTFLYVLMGWVIIFAIKPIIANISPYGLYFLVAGGISYTIGTIFYLFRLFKYHHAVWHIFVLAGSIFHFLTIYLYLK